MRDPRGRLRARELQPVPGTDERDYGELWDLGEIMVRSWQATLARDFPGRQFDVTPSDDYGPTVCAITVRPESS